LLPERTGKVLRTPKMYVLLNHTKNTAHLNDHIVTFRIPINSQSKRLDI
jgi:hypothetical protein